MIYITGDTHGNFDHIEYFTNRFRTSKHDLLIILGDAGVNYFQNYRDKELKEFISNLPITMLCVRGNHEERPEDISTYDRRYITTNTFEATCFVENEYPSLYFLDNGLIKIHKNDKILKGFVINGAYSVDKYFRLAVGHKWFDNEQLSESEMNEITKTIPNHLDFIISHTCPEKYIPKEMFLPGLDQTTVDRSMEIFLDSIEEKVSYNKWYCGHWHCNKKIDKLQFLFNDILEFDGGK